MSQINVKYLNADGSVNTGAIQGAGGRALQEAIYKEISSAKSIVDGINNANKAIKDADEQIAELGQKISEAFYQWENELTEVYSLTQRINNEVSFTNRFTSQIELELAKLNAGFGDTEQSIENIRNVLTRNNATIQAQIKNQQQMIAARQRELEAALSYEDELEKLQKYQNKTDWGSDAEKNATIDWASQLAEGAKLGSKYVKKDLFKDIDGSIQYNIDWEQFEADNAKNPYSKTTYEAIKQYLDDLNSAATDFNDSIKEQTEFIKQTYEALREYQDYISDMEDTLIKGVEEQIEEAKNNAKQLSDSITGALKDLLDEVKRKLDERRKQEDNAKTERDISQKQQRLAALRADTAGGHQVEIAQLEKEIADSQQSYQRTLEDQLLERLQLQADLASQQRERQIELLEAGNLIAAANNKELVDMWLRDPQKYKDEIYNAWMAANDYDNKGVAEQYLLRQAFESNFAQLQTAVEQAGFGTALKQRDDMIELFTNTLSKASSVDDSLTSLWLKDPQQYKNQLYDAWLEANAEDTTTEEGFNSVVSTFNTNFDLLVKSIEDAENADVFSAIGTDTNSLVSLLEELTNGELGREDKLAHDVNALADITDRNTTSILTELRKQNSVEMLRAKGASATTLKTVGYTASELLKGGYEIDELKEAGFTAKELREGGVDDIDKLINAQYGAADLKDAGFNASDLKGADFTAKDLKDIFSLDELIEAAFDTKALKEAGFGAGDLKAKGFDILQLKDAGYSLPELKNAFSAAEFGAGGITYAEAKAAGYNLNDLKPVTEYAAQAKKEQDELDAAARQAAAQAAWNAAHPYGLVSSYSGTIDSGDKGNKVKAVQALNRIIGAGLAVDGSFGSKTKNAVKKFQKATGISADGKVGNKTKGKFAAYGYKTGGLADYTGPAWLDGTPSKPELVLNPTDTKNFLALRDVLSSAMKTTSSVNNSYGGDTTYEININVDKLTSDYDVDKVAERVKKIIVKDSSYRNVTQVRNLR